MRIATFNVQNLRLRHGAAGDWLEGARDADDPQDQAAGAAALDPEDRRLTAGLLSAIDADLVALQEVFDAETLDHFHDRWLMPTGTAPYPHRICLPGNDGRGLDLALMSRLPVSGVTSHAGLTMGDLGLGAEGTAARPVFRRDCLMAEARGITLFLCHFKAPYPDPASAWQVRRTEALAVRALIARRFADPAAALWLVLGDLNDPAVEDGRESAAVPLLGDFSVDLMARRPEGDRWTYLDPQTGRRSQPDGMLASPALARAWPRAVPQILRAGLGRETDAQPAAPHLPGVGRHRPHASDHAAVFLDLDGI